MWRETSPGAVIPYPPLHWRVPFPNVRLNKGQRRCFLPEKRENRKYESKFMMAKSRRKVGIRRCQGSPRDTGKYRRKLSSSCFPSGR